MIRLFLTFIASNCVRYGYGKSNESLNVFFCRAPLTEGNEGSKLHQLDNITEE